MVAYKYQKSNIYIDGSEYIHLYDFSNVVEYIEPQGSALLVKHVIYNISQKKSVIMGNVIMPSSIIHFNNINDWQFIEKSQFDKLIKNEFSDARDDLESVLNFLNKRKWGYYNSDYYGKKNLGFLPKSKPSFFPELKYHYLYFTQSNDKKINLCAISNTTYSHLEEHLDGQYFVGDALYNINRLKTETFGYISIPAEFLDFNNIKKLELFRI
jgi:hypothetical protein